jgi:hypothetical protein
MPLFGIPFSFIIPPALLMEERVSLHASKCYQKGNKAGNRVNWVFEGWNCGIFLMRDLFLIEIFIDQAIVPFVE